MPDENPPDLSSRAYQITRVIVQILLPFFGGITVRGAENIPTHGPVILAPSHKAYMDPPYLSMITRRQLHVMAKEELFHVPMIGPYVKALGAFPVKRGSADRAALRRAVEELKAGHILTIFPEGTRSEPGQLLPAEKGFALIARQTGAPIVPVALEGTNVVLPKDSKRFHRARVVATIGKPQTAQEMLDNYYGVERDPLTIICTTTMAAIAALLTKKDSAAS